MAWFVLLKESLPDSRGPLKVPPTMGMTMRSCPFGTGPRENLSPSKASMLYSKVSSGGVGAFSGIVQVASEMNVVRRPSKCMFHRTSKLGYYLAKRCGTRAEVRPLVLYLHADGLCTLDLAFRRRFTLPFPRSGEVHGKFWVVGAPASVLFTQIQIPADLPALSHCIPPHVDCSFAKDRENLTQNPIYRRCLQFRVPSIAKAVSPHDQQQPRKSAGTDRICSQTVIEAVP